MLDFMVQWEKEADRTGGELEQIFVVGLEFHMSFRFQNFIISAEEGLGSQTDIW